MRYLIGVVHPSEAGPVGAPGVSGHGEGCRRVVGLFGIA